MKKRVSIALILLAFILFLPLVLGANETGEGYEKAYSCLENKLGDNCAGTLSTEQAAFSLLAIAYKSSLKSDCRDSLMDKEQDNCFGATETSSCDLKSTAQAIIALDHIGKDVDDYSEWLLDKRELTKDLNWFLEIDANEETTCKIEVNDANEGTFTINEDKKVSGSSSCLSPGEGGYFLSIKNNCYNDNFTISCDKDFITTLLYKRTGSSVYYVSSKTHSASAEGTTEEAINSFCFGTSSQCNYEGSLWAALALGKIGEDISPYLPYLTAMYDESENQKYFPSAFLHMLTSEDDYYVDVVEKQKQGKYWEEDKNKYYDTALALLALQNFIIDEVANAKDYLLEIQDSSGCWHSDNIRDTSFILYAAWPKVPSGDDGESSRSYCEQFGHYCVSPSDCDSEDNLDNFYCPGLSDVCCKTEPYEQSCEEKQGIICQSGYECTGSEVTASNTAYCCLGSCIEVDTTTDCEDYGYTCKSSCGDGEEEKFYECGFGEACCGEQPAPERDWTLVILLIILIILVILAIIFRNQLKLWWFKIKSKLKFGKPPKSTGRPSFPPPSHPLFQRPRPGPRMPFRRPRYQYSEHS